MSFEAPLCDGSARKQLATVVDTLFRGATIELGGKLLCFRGRGEVLPDLPHSGMLSQAVEPGLYMSADVFANGRVSGTPDDQKWLLAGPLEEIEATLKALEAPPDIVAQVQMQLAFGAHVRGCAFDTPVQVYPHQRVGAAAPRRRTVRALAA